MNKLKQVLSIALLPFAQGSYAAGGWITENYKVTLPETETGLHL